MAERSVTHATFVVQRTSDASSARVFRAFADPAVKARWFGGPDDWSRPETAFEFRVGGREYHRGELEGQMHTFDGVYWDIVPDERIVFSYDMHLDQTRISVSLANYYCLAPSASELLSADAGRRAQRSAQPGHIRSGNYTKEER